jgi:GxxExxY protein
MFLILNCQQQKERFKFLTTEPTEKMLSVNQITETIIGCAIKVHSALGPGLLESAYQQCLFYELKKSGLKVEKEKPLPVIYEEIELECGYRLDLLVENRVVVELKAVEALTDINLAQMLTYLKLSECEIGLLINFNVTQLIKGIKRVINN